MGPLNWAAQRQVLEHLGVSICAPATLKRRVGKTVSLKEGEVVDGRSESRVPCASPLIAVNRTDCAAALWLTI